MRAPDAGGGAIATETLQKLLATPLTVYTELTFEIFEKFVAPGDAHFAPLQELRKSCA